MPSFRSILDKVSKLIEPKPSVDLSTARLFNGANPMWGDHISFWNTGHLEGEGPWRVYGHKANRPRENDLLIFPMVSGKQALFQFVTVQRMSDPPDMFFGDVVFIGYVGELKPEFEEFVRSNL